MSEQEKGPTKTETMLGGATITVTRNGESPELVKVRQVPVKEFPAYLAALEDELAMGALLTGKTMQWVETLEPESHELLINTGDRINRDFFARWVERRMKRNELLVPGFSQRLLASVAPETRSRTSSP